MYLKKNIMYCFWHICFRPKSLSYIKTNVFFALLIHFMVLLLDYPSLFSFSLWVVCSSPFLYMHDALLLSSKRCSVVPASCAVCAYTNTPTRRPGCRTSAIDLWAFGFLPCAVHFLSTLFFHCCRFKIPPSPICLFLKSPFLLCDILFHASVWVI